MGVDCKPNAPAALPPGKGHRNLFKKLGGHEGRFGRVSKKICLAPTRFRNPNFRAASQSFGTVKHNPCIYGYLL